MLFMPLDESLIPIFIFHAEMNIETDPFISISFKRNGNFDFLFLNLKDIGSYIKY